MSDTLQAERTGQSWEEINLLVEQFRDEMDRADCIPPDAEQQPTMLDAPRQVVPGLYMRMAAVAAGAAEIVAGYTLVLPARPADASPIVDTSKSTLSVAIPRVKPTLNGLVPVDGPPIVGVGPDIISSLVMPKTTADKRPKAPPTLMDSVNATLRNSVPSQPESAPLPVIKEEAKSKAAEIISTFAVSPEGIDLILSSEGWRSEIYNDEGNHATIGYGHKIHDGPRDGSEPEEFRRGISKERGKELFQADLDRFEAGVRALVKVPINQGQFDALTSLGYNIGLRALKESTALKELNQGNYDAVPEQFRRWAYVNGEFVVGLAERREREILLWNQGNIVQTPPTEAARVEEAKLQYDIGALVSKLTLPSAPSPRLRSIPPTTKAPISSPELQPRVDISKPTPEAIADELGGLTSKELYRRLLIPTRPVETAANPPKVSSEARRLRHELIDRASLRVESNGVQSVEVRGIRIRVEAAENLAKLLAAAEADGFHLTSSPRGALRNTEMQAELRVENGCPDVLTAPASACQRPTARPGESNHESPAHDPKAYAVDFMDNGEPILSWDHPASKWLDKNGPKFGFYGKIIEEPNHRSGTGY